MRGTRNVGRAAHLSDADLLTGTRRLAGRSNQLLAELLLHLGEVEARGIHRTRACSSLYTYCIYELRFSEDEAFRRVAAVPATIAAPETPERVFASPDRIEPERYKVQFTATEEYVRLVEEAKALLSHAVPNVTLEELQLRAMRALVAELKKKKYATFESSSALVRECEMVDAPSQDASRTRRESPGALDQDVHSADALEQDVHRTEALEQGAERPHPRRRVRHIPAAVRRSVFERDGNRCSYLDANGARCRETRRLEFHHLKPFATGGPHCASNLTLRCAAHNALAAEADFERELMEDRKNSLLHERFGSFNG